MDRRSFVQLDARARATALFDEGCCRELLGPSCGMGSPWLARQGITPQADDGCVVMKGRIAAQTAVVMALDGSFLGGSVGEVSGMKMTAALDLACADNQRGIPTSAVLLLESGGARLSEANLGMEAVAEILASMLALRRHAPVISVVAGPTGCFGGMSLAAELSSYLVLTRQARLGLSGPRVIEQESGVEELDASDSTLIQAIFGGEQRHAMGLADALVEDDTEQVAGAVRRLLASGLPRVYRSSQVANYRGRLAALDGLRLWEPAALRVLWNEAAGGEESA